MLDYVRRDLPTDPKIHFLLVNGKIADEENNYVVDEEGKHLIAVVRSPDVHDQVIEFTFDDVLSQFEAVTMFHLVLLNKDFSAFTLHDIMAYREDGTFFLSFIFEFAIDEWKHPWTMIEHVKEFKRVLTMRNVEDAEWVADEDSTPFEAQISFGVSDPHVTIQSRIESCLPILEDLHEQALTNLYSKSRSHSVVMRFAFPDEVKVPCEQYLLYFIQFLQDVGIEATAEIKEAAGKVLFSVTPTDKEEALENIRTALDIFLHLPSSPAPSTLGSIQTSIEAQRLEANILHLRSQLVLAQAQLALAATNTQQKDIIIEQQQAFIRQQLASGEILVQSIQVTSAGDDKEPVVGDIVSIKKFDWQFVELDLPTLIRRLKQLFKP
jgi:hypothetical protein